MKKIFSIISAGLMLLSASSCVKDNQVVFDPAKTSAPVLLSFDCSPKKVTAEYTPASFKMGFNENMKVNHTIALVATDGKAVSKVLASGSDGKVSVTRATISKALTSLGYSYGKTVAVELAIRASLQDPTKDNGRNGFVDSKDRIAISDFLVEEPAKNPFEGFTKESPWGVTGSIASAGISWDKDIAMVSDGTWHVAKSVTLTVDDQFKFRKDGSWDVNVGAVGDTEPFVVSLDEEIGGVNNGKNLAVGTDGTYDLWVNGETFAFKVTEAYNPYPDYKDACTWGITGALSSYGINWDGDIAMLTDGKNSFLAQGVRITKEDQFKFRKDQAWDENYGAAGDVEPFVASLDTPFEASAGGKNLAVPADGVFDLIINTEAKTITIVETLGGPASKKIGGDTPEPGPTFTGWSVIGTVNGGTEWNTDYDMDEIADGVFYINGVSLTADSEFKIRKDHDWTTAYGTAAGAAVALDAAFAATTDNGGNIKLGSEAKVDITLNTNENTILLATHKALYSLIGSIEGTSWNKDFNMTEEGGKWIIKEVQIDGEFKVRYDASWDDDKCYGVADGQTYGVGTPFTLTQPGANIVFDAGKYNVTFDPDAKTLLVESAVKTWGIVGDFTGWGSEKDVTMTEVVPGIWVSPKTTIAEGGWKVRFDSGWDVNYGGSTPTETGKFVQAVGNGDNLSLHGDLIVVLNLNNGTLGTLGWGVTGSIASCPNIAWSNDIPMNLTSDGTWVSSPIALTTADEIKVRFGAGWDQNFGGSCTAADEPFTAVAGGDNIKVPADGTYVIVYNPGEGQICVSSSFCGLIGAFNGWAADDFMFYAGEGKFYSFNRHYEGEWKIRMSAGWTVNRGGTYAWDSPFAVTQDGPNITVEDGVVAAGFNIFYDSVGETVTINQSVML